MGINYRALSAPLLYSVFCTMSVLQGRLYRVARGYRRDTLTDTSRPSDPSTDSPRICGCAGRPSCPSSSATHPHFNLAPERSASASAAAAAAASATVPLTTAPFRRWIIILAVGDEDHQSFLLSLVVFAPSSPSRDGGSNQGEESQWKDPARGR